MVFILRADRLEEGGKGKMEKSPHLIKFFKNVDFFPFFPLTPSKTCQLEQINRSEAEVYAVRGLLCVLRHSIYCIEFAFFYKYKEIIFTLYTNFKKLFHKLLIFKWNILGNWPRSQNKKRKQIISQRIKQSEATLSANSFAARLNL
jgi:hypothetical protein